MRTAVLVPCYNRPQYLKEVLSDLLAMPQVRMGLPVILACDGGDNAAVADNLAVATSAKIPCLHILVRPEHLGIGRNVYEAKRYVFEECRFDQVFFVEDDIRLSPHTLTLLLNLKHWLGVNYTNGCVIGTTTQCNLSLEEKQADLALVSDCGAMLNNHLLTREGWNLMRPWMHEYVTTFLQCAYRDRSSERIVEWMKTLALRLPVQGGERMFPVHWPFKEYFLDKPVTSQDGAMALAIRLAGFAHVTTTVNRGWHIGKHGENAAGEDWWDRVYGNTALDIFESDNTRTYFRVRA